MTIFDLLFILSVLFVVILLVRIAISALRRRWSSTLRLGRLLGGFLALYFVALVGFALALPRKIYAPGERRCFDDWCAIAVEAKPADAAGACPADPGSSEWIAAIEVSSLARGIRQRARDAHAELEDRQGARYSPCAPALAQSKNPARVLTDPLGPGESFRVYLPFRLPAGRTPAGLVLHHGDNPGAVIIGADQSLLHTPAIQRFPAQPSR